MNVGHLNLLKLILFVLYHVQYDFQKVKKALLYMLHSQNRIVLRDSIGSYLQTHIKDLIDFPTDHNLWDIVEDSE